MSVAIAKRSYRRIAPKAEMLAANYEKLFSSTKPNWFFGLCVDT
jgi:hypothetical protein